MWINSTDRSSIVVRPERSKATQDEPMPTKTDYPRVTSIKQKLNPTRLDLTGLRAANDSATPYESLL